MPFESEFLFCDDLPKRIMNISTNETFLMNHLSLIIHHLKCQKTCADSLKSLGIAFRIGTKGITLVNTRNLSETATATAASTQDNKEYKYGRSPWI